MHEQLIWRQVWVAIKVHVPLSDTWGLSFSKVYCVSLVVESHLVEVALFHADLERCLLFFL